MEQSHPTMGAWIEILVILVYLVSYISSHPTMGAWIEIFSDIHNCFNNTVAPHDGCVD